MSSCGRKVSLGFFKGISDDAGLPRTAAHLARRAAPAAGAALTAALVLLGCERERPLPPRPKLTGADREAVVAEMTALRTKADKADKERRAAVDKAPPLSDDPSALKCPVTVKQLLGEFEETDLILNRTGINNKAHNITELYPPPEWWHGAGRARGFVDSAFGTVEYRMDPDHDSGETAQSLLAQVRVVELPDHVLTIVPEETVKPVLVGSDKFQGGLLAGRAYLWSEREKRLTCGARVRAQSSENVKSFGSGNMGLLMDLIATACIQAAYNLTVLPEAPPQPSSSTSASPPGKKSPPRKSAP